MSGLDGLGWPNPEDEPKPKKNMNSQLEIKLAPTPETDQCVKANKHLRFLQEDHYVGNSKTTYENPIVFLSRKLERERNEWKAKYIQQNKDLGCEMMDPNGTIWDYAKKVQRELTVVTKQRDNFEDRLRVELGGHPDSELWGDAGLIAATMRCLDALDTVTEQRDRLAAVLQRIRDGYGGQAAAPDCCEDCEFLIPIDEALQSLNQPTEL